MEAGLHSGIGDGKFGIGQSLTREAMAIIFVNAFGEQDSRGPVPSLDKKDADSISDWAKDAVAFAVDANLLTGGTNGYFNPQNPTIRQDVWGCLLGHLMTVWDSPFCY